MANKKIAEGLTRPKGPTFNSLIQQLEDPRSLVNLLPEDVRAGVLTISDYLINMDEDEIVKHFENSNQEISNTLSALRSNFWMEFDRVSATRTEMMNMGNIYLGVCSKPYWYRLTTDNKESDKLAYILIKPPEYEAVMGGMLSLATRKLRDIMNIPLKNSHTGEYQDAKTLELILKAIAMVDLRVKGGYLQRSESKNLTHLETKNSGSVTHIFTAASNNKSAIELEADINKQIQDLEKEIKALPTPQHDYAEIVEDKK